MPRSSLARTSAPSARPRRATAALSRPTRAIDLEERGQRTVSPLELGLVELPTRPRSVYTMGQRKAAIEGCEQGLLRDAADLTLAAITESGYCRGILDDLVRGILGLPRTFAGRADMIAELDDTTERVGQFREMLPGADLARLLAWGITLGVAPGQMRRKYGARPSYDYPISPEEAADWKNVRKLVGQRNERPVGAPDLRVLRTWSPKWLRCQWWEDSAWYLMTADGEIRISHLEDPPAKNDNGQPIPDGNRDEWMLFCPFGEIKPWEWGSWKSATLAFVAERDATFDRLRHSEVLAPARVGTVPQGTTERQRRQYLKLIHDMQRMASFVLPAGLDYKIVESTGRVAEVYRAIIEWAERQYAMISGALTTATGTPGFSKGDVQERFTRSILSAFADALSECIHRFALVPWARTNWSTDDAPRAEWDCEPPEDKKTRAETLLTAASAFDKTADALAKHDRKLTDASVERYWQGLGLETERLPVRTPHPKIEITPSDRKVAYKLDEIRAGDGWPSIGDERGDLTVAEAEELAKRKAASAPEPGGEPASDLAASEAPTDEDAAALAAKMTLHAVERCAHDRPNRCPLCGVERLRDFSMGDDGAIRWHVAWRPILRARPAAPAEAPPEPAPEAALAVGGDLAVRVFSGIRVRIDRPRGFVQTGSGGDGQRWERTYIVDYGFIDGTRGGDREEFDVFCGPDRFAPQAFVAAQINGDGRFDEYKLFLGFESVDAARACYAAHIPPQFLAGMFALPVEALRGFLGLEPRAKNALALRRPNGAAHPPAWAPVGDA